MIKIIKGTYGHYDGSKVNPITEESGPQSFAPKIEERLVKKGVAVYVDEPLVEDNEKQDDQTGTQTDDSLPEYNKDMKVSELIEIAKAYGVDAEGVRTKAAVIEMIEAAKAQDDEEGDENDDDLLPPDVSAAMPE